MKILEPLSTIRIKTVTDLQARIAEKETMELILMANGSTADWQQLAIDLARDELRRRGITAAYEKRVVDRWKAEQRQQEMAYQAKLLLNETEGYSPETMIAIFFAAPLILSDKWSIGLSLIGLKRENYQKKFIQRLLLLCSGTAFWLVAIMYVANSSYIEAGKIRQAEIDNVDISEWERSYYDSDSSLTTLHKDTR